MTICMSCNLDKAEDYLTRAAQIVVCDDCAEILADVVAAKRALKDFDKEERLISVPRDVWDQVQKYLRPGCVISVKDLAKAVAAANEIRN